MYNRTEPLGRPQINHRVQPDGLKENGQVIGVGTVDGFHLRCQLQLIESYAEKDSKITSLLKRKECIISQERPHGPRKDDGPHARCSPSPDWRPDEAGREKESESWQEGRAEKEIWGPEVAKVEFSPELSEPRPWPREGLAE